MEQINGLDILSSGGGVGAEEKNVLQKAIIRKINSVQKYPDNHYKKMELAILRTDIPSIDWMQSAINWIREIIVDQEKVIFDKIYVLGRDCCFWYEQNGNYGVQNIDKTILEKLKIIARMTAEKQITLDDEEWN